MITSEALQGRTLNAFTLAKRFQKFLVVGTIGLAVNQIMLYVFQDLFSMRLFMSSVLAIAVSMIVTFVLNEAWTWHDRGTGPIGHRLMSYVPINTGGLIINAGVLLFLVNQFEMHKFAANLIGAGLAAIWNFGLNSVITWRA